MGKYTRDGSGRYCVCETCGKKWYENYPEMYVYKMEISNRKDSHKTVYFCKATCKWKFEDKYEEELEQKRVEAARKRHEARMKKQAEGKKPGRKKMSEEEKAKAAAERAGKFCIDCRYAERDHYGFLYCTHQYKIKPSRKACGLFRQKDEGVRCG